MLSAMTVSYPRRQQVRRLMRAVRLAAGALLASAGAALLASAGYTGVAVLLGAAAVVLGLLSRRALHLARRSRVGAESEAQVRRELELLARQGWRVAHAVDWPGRGDLDHVLRSPSGMGFVIETKTLRYSRAHVTRTLEAARWLARMRHRYPCGVVPVVCVTRAGRLECGREARWSFRWIVCSTRSAGPRELRRGRATGALYAAFNTCDIDAVLAALADDVDRAERVGARNGGGRSAAREC